MSRWLILVRHAHRDTRNKKRDNGLSKKGRKQSLALATFFDDQFAGHSVCFTSSPKLRCVETLQPLAKKLRIKIAISPELREKEPKEAATRFRLRIKKIIEHWPAENPQIWVVCGHGDGIPLALRELIGLPIELKKGGVAILEISGAKRELLWLLPTLI